MITIYNPDVKLYKKSAIQAIEDGWISNHGKFIELSTNKLFSLEEREFNRILHEKFIEYQNNIKKREYKEEEENESSSENYSLE